MNGFNIIWLLRMSPPDLTVFDSKPDQLSRTVPEPDAPDAAEPDESDT